MEFAIHPIHNTKEPYMIVITGATGQTGSKLADLLIAQGERVRVIGRSADTLQRFAEKGAQIRAGDQADAGFLTNALREADAAYLLIPPKMDSPDIRKHYNQMGEVILGSIRDSGIKKVIFLSSLGADRSEGTGPVLGLHDVENKLRTLKGVDIIFLRPGYFMENTMMNLGLIKHQKINGNPTAPQAMIMMVATKDIAAKAADLLTNRSWRGHAVVDLFSYQEATTIIGEKVGVSGLPYIQFADADAIKAMTGMGLSASVAESFVDLAHGLSAGKVIPTVIDGNKPNAPTRFEEFVEEVFEPAYRNAA
jgi:uncharacterized protein YbjT (DUF2867 family)